MGAHQRYRMTARPYCCGALKQHVEHRCSVHPNPFDCPDHVVVYLPQFDEFGLVIRDGGNGSGESYLEIVYCPWCGTKLPESKRDRYFEQLEARGIDPATDTIPIKFYSDAWWTTPDQA